jgi:hypothetical protein
MLLAVHNRGVNWAMAARLQTATVAQTIGRSANL